ncbi:hypothetical protein ACQ4PT_042972 [Festuca glaucescens]
MGAGKEAPPASGAGDGTGNEAAEPPQPVVLRMVLHCDGCAKKVKKSIHHMPGVVSVVADAAANTVIVAGTADAAALKARIESRTKKPVQIVSAGGSATPPPAEPKKNPNKGAGGGQQEKKNPDKGGGAGAESQLQPPKEEKKQPPEDTAVLLRIRLHCDSCADRIRRRIYKIKGVKDVILEGNAKDEVKVVGTMDVPAMVAYLNEKLNRTVEAVAPGSSKDDKGGDGDGDGHIKKDKAAAASGHGAHKDKGKGIEVAGPSMASAAASMAPATVQASTHHVSPYGYGNVTYPQQPPQGPPPGYYSGGNADGAGYATPYYQQQPRGDAGSYYQQQPRGDAGSYYQHQPRGDSYYHQPPSADAGSYYQHQPRGDSYYHQPPSADAGSYYQHQPRGDSYYHQPPSGDTGSYYQHPGGYDQHPNPPPYNPYPFDTAPPPQMFSDENPNSCSVM